METGHKKSKWFCDLLCTKSKKVKSKVKKLKVKRTKLRTTLDETMHQKMERLSVKALHFADNLCDFKCRVSMLSQDVFFFSCSGKMMPADLERRILEAKQKVTCTARNT